MNAPETKYDAVIVGSGPNGLSAGIVPARACVLVVFMACAATTRPATPGATASAKTYPLF